MMPQDPRPQDPKPQDPSGADEPLLDATGELRGEELLHWEEESYGFAPEGSGNADAHHDPEWFADLVDDRMDDQERRSREASLLEDPDLEARYRAYTRATNSLRALGKAEAEDRGSPFLKARILASIQEEQARDAGAGDASTVPVRKRGVIPALMGSMGVAAAALFGLLYLLEWGATNQHQPEMTKSAEGFYQDGVAGDVASTQRKGLPKGVQAGRTERDAPLQILDGVESRGGGSSGREGMRSGESSQRRPPGESAKASRDSNTNRDSKKGALKAAGETVSRDAKTADEKELGDFALGRGKKGWGNQPVPRSQGKAQGSDGFEGPSGQTQNDSAKGESELLSKKSKKVGVARTKSGGRAPLESKPQEDKEVLQLEEVAAVEEEEVEAEKKADGKSPATKKLDSDDPAASAGVVTVKPDKAGKVGTNTAYLEGLALLLDARGRGEEPKTGNLGAANGIPRYKVSRGLDEGEVLLFAVEMSPQQVIRVTPKLGLLEQQRLFFSRASVTLAPGAGAFGGGAKSPAVPAKVSQAPTTPGAPASDHSAGEAKKSEGASGSKNVDRGLAHAESDEEQQRADEKQHAFGQNVVSGTGFPKKVALHDLYTPEELYSTSNVVNRHGDEVLFLRGSKDQILSALKLLIEASDRHALAYVPKSTMSPMAESLTVRRMRKGMEVGQRSGGEETKNDGGSVDKRVPRSAKARSKPAGDPQGKDHELDRNTKAEEAPEPIQEGPVPGGLRKKVDLPSPTKPSPIGKPSDNLAKQRADQFEIRVLIRRGRYAVPGRAGRAGLPGTPAPGKPTPVTPATGTPPLPEPRKNK